VSTGNAELFPFGKFVVILRSSLAGRNLISTGSPRNEAQEVLRVRRPWTAIAFGVIPG
jgi:hypothetical protein